MKSLLLSTALVCAFAVPAWSEEAKPAPKAVTITCGKTLEDCQKQVDDLTAKLGEMTLTAQGAIQQRDANASSVANTQLQQFVQQQKAAIAATPPAPAAPAKK